MNYAPLVAPGLVGPEYQAEEFQIMIRTTFKSYVKDGIINTPWGRQIPIDGDIAIDPTLRVEEALVTMDAAGVDVAVLACLKMWSYYYHHRLIIDTPEEIVAEALSINAERFIGTAGYNPLRIDESLRTIETMVRDHGFRYVYFHPITFGVAPDDARCYPLYAKCSELNIPVGLQVGHSAEVLPSDIGRPYLVDRVAIDFPNLRINLSHTGWPWTGEFCSMIWRHPNVYGDISAYLPTALDADLVKFFDSSRGRNKVMWGTNGLDMQRSRADLEALPIKESTVARLLRLNALEFFDLK
jgi:hypothetical protein